MISEPFGRQFDVDAPERAPSAARLAAEAFFAPRAEPAPGETAPDVVVRRSRLEESHPSTAARPSVTLTPTRESRVFRLPGPLAVADVTEAKVHEGPEGSESDSRPQVSTLPVDALPVPRGAGRRKKRRHLHGEVTITRPTAPSVDVVRTLEPSTTTSLQVLSAAQPFPSSDSVSAELYSWEWPRYLALRRHLLALQTQAQEAKRHEAQAALVWIQQAIADYGITPADLGLER